MGKGWRAAHITVRQELWHTGDNSHKVSIALGRVHLLKSVAYKHMWNAVCSIWMATLKSMAPPWLAAVLQLPLTLC